MCGALTNLEFSDRAGDAPCPNCGHLLWLSAELLSSLQNQFADTLGVATSRIMPDTELNDIGADSLERVELIMTMEEELDEPIPEDVLNRIYTVGDLIR